MTPRLPAGLQPPWKAARRRAMAILLATALPPLLVAAAVAWRLGETTALAGSVLAGALLVLLLARVRLARFDQRWLARRLDATRADMEDSAELLFAAPSSLSPLQQLQARRLHARIADGATPDLRPPWPVPRLTAVLAASLLVLAAVLLWPRPTPETSIASGPPPRAATAAAPPRLVASRLEVTPPAYTAQPARSAAALDVRVPEGSRLRWRLRMDPAPDDAALLFLDGRRLPLRRVGGDWIAEARADLPVLYRIVTTGERPLPPDRPYRIDVDRDLPPQVQVSAPAANLTLRATGQRQWALAFEASDDHGVAADAQLRITAAQGTGENIRFREETRTLRGSGTRARKRFSHQLDLAALGLAEGDDLVVQVTVRDNRAPRPQETRSASYILRWAAPQPDMDSGLEGLVRTTLPAYFRSQRQIIIDAEALIAKRDALSRDRFVDRSDAIGVDQRLLRLRYGQFLGEESEGAPKRPLMPTNDAEDVAARREEAAVDTHGHDHGDEDATAEPVQGFGRAGDLLAEFGHTHDHAEAAALLDPETRTTLRAALDAMWQSERELRQGAPAAALPHANRALTLIKQVQQASRIYLGRVGNQLPPVDFSRRLSGKREGLGDRPAALVAADRERTAGEILWQALQPGQSPSAEPLSVALDATARWLRDHPARVADPLALSAAIDGVRREPSNAERQQALRAQLWPVVVAPPAAPAARATPDRSARAYLEALGAGDGP